MKEFVQEILEEEKKARERIEEAQKMASQKILKAHDEVRRMLKEAREQALVDANAIFSRAEEEAKKEKSLELDKATQKQRAILLESQKKIDKMAELLFTNVIGEDFNSL